jgi:DNA polymerase III sliding clamp (beta) subunit (PCNA family)
MILQTAARGHTIFPNRNVGKESPNVDIMFIDCRNSEGDQTIKLISCTDRSCAQTEMAIGEKISIQDMNTRIVAVEAKAFFRAVCSFGEDIPLKVSVAVNADGAVSAVSVGSRDNAEESQTLPAKTWDSYPSAISVPKHKKSITCNLGELKKSIARIEFAFGIGASNPNYEFVKIRKDGDGLSLVSGNGAVFARTSLPCSSSNLDESSCYFIPCREIKNAIACMDGIISDGEQVVISFSKDSAAIRAGGFSMVTSLADSITWPDENVVFNRNSSHRIKSEMSSWESVLEGIRAVFEHENSINELCTTTISASSVNRLKVSTGKQYKSERSISCDRNDSSQSMPSIKCQSASLLHSVKNSHGCEIIALEVDGGTLNGNPAPIVMRFSKSSAEEDSRPFFETFFVQAQA